MTIEAKVVAHSAYYASGALSHIMTMQLRYPRFIHAELMTHREFSRNASSSRAVPTRKIIDQIKNDIAEPVEWGRNQGGMQAGAKVADEAKIRKEWQTAANDAIYHAERMLKNDPESVPHKQIINRILEPFSHISVVVTSTQWKNFFDLRLSPAADPTMRALAEAMNAAINESAPRLLDEGEWHAPYVDKGIATEKDVMQSVAMCARVSYLRHDGEKPTAEENENLAARLLTEKHMSPFEHQARPAKGRYYNLHLWRSFRFDIENPEKPYWSPFRKYTPTQRLELKRELKDETVPFSKAGRRRNARKF